MPAFRSMLISLPAYAHPFAFKNSSTVWKAFEEGGVS
jgi:hypothetical protein